MGSYFPRLLSMAALFVWASQALACDTWVSDETSFLSLRLWFMPLWFEGGRLLISLLTVSLFSTLLLLLIYGIRKLALKKTTRWADVCWPTALVNCLLLGGIGNFLIPAFGDVFTNFGVDLPAPTLLIMVIPQTVWVLPFVAALIFKCIERQPRLGAWLSIQLAALFLLVITLWALYLPVFMVC